MLLYALSEKWQLSATWSYQTGSHITLPTAKIPNTNIAFEDIFFPVAPISTLNKTTLFFTHKVLFSSALELVFS